MFERIKHANPQLSYVEKAMMLLQSELRVKLIGISYARGKHPARLLEIGGKHRSAKGNEPVMEGDESNGERQS